MLLKLLFLAIVLYYVIKTSKALIRAVAGSGPASELRDHRPPGPDVRPGGSRPTAERDDVEDAKFVDL